MNRWMAVAGAAAMMCLGTTSVMAQQGGGGGGGFGGGNFDPAQMQQRILDRTKETLEVTSDDEWKAMEPLVLKVMEARRDSMGGMGRGMFGGGRRNRNGGDTNAADQGGGGGQRRGGFFNQTPSPEAEALQKAIDAKAPKAEVKAALDKYVASRKAKQAELEQAQENLRKVLTSRQEAIATLNGLL
jgi:hypothetical protein